MPRRSAKGMFDDLINVILPELVDAALNTGGALCVEELQSGVSKDEGRLHGSLSYATQKRAARVSGSAGESDGAPQPDKPFLMYLGTRVPYAWYVEHGSGPHNTGNDSEGFIERITAWAWRHGWAEDEMGALINSIRKKGTEKHPFFFEKGAIVERIMGEALKKAMMNLPATIQRSGPIVVDIDIASNKR